MRMSDWSSDVCSSELARRLEVGRHVGEHELGVLEVRNRLAELLAVLGIGNRFVEAALRAAQGTGADVEPPAVEPRHREAETVALGARPEERRVGKESVSTGRSRLSRVQ